jgi:hypothetical protein
MSRTLCEGVRTCSACGASHAVLTWQSERNDLPRSPVHERRAWRCRKCGAVLVEDDESDGTDTTALLADAPWVGQLRADAARTAKE